MEKKHKRRQNQPDKGQEKPTATTGKDVSNTIKAKKKNIEVSRPRMVSDSERRIQHGIEKTQQKTPREFSKTRDLGLSVRPRTISDSGRVIQHNIEKILQRKPRELTRTRGLGSAVRPPASRSQC